MPPKTLFLVIYLVFGQVGIYGRYQWDSPFAFRSFFCFSFFYWLFFPALWVGLNRWFKSFGHSLGIFLILSIPYILPLVWMGIDPLGSIKNSTLVPWNGPGLPIPATDWLPGALSHLPNVPGEGVFFGGFAVLALIFLKGKWKAVGLLLLLETWLHLSLRSPYTYIPHFEHRPEEHYWYHYYLVGLNSGAVNLDYHLFRPAEEMFLGIGSGMNLLGSRLFPTFLVSPFLVFFSPYWVWISFNLLSWMLGMVFLHRLAKEIFDEKLAWVATFFFAVAQGPILYVAQPMLYTSAISATACVVTLTYFLGRSQKNSWKELGAFAAILACWQLSYENQPWYLAILLFPLAMGNQPLKFLPVVLVSMGLHFGFLQSQKFLPGLEPMQALAPVGGHPISNLLNTIRSGNVGKLILLFLWSLRGFGRVMVHAFNFALIPAILGLWQIRGSKVSRVLWLMMLPAFLTYSMMEMGESFYTRFPRLVYSAYPAIFLAAGVGMLSISNRWLRWVPMAMYAVYVNSDVFGFPWIYHVWFDRVKGFSF